MSAAAAGADLIVLEEAIHRGIHTHVIVPIALDEFIHQSVIDAGPEWVGRLNVVLHHISTHDGCSVAQGDGLGGHAGFLAAHDQLLDRAKAVAGDDDIVALTVRPPEGEVPPSVTDDFAARAERLGWLVLCIDPRPDSSSVVTVR